MCVSHCKCQLYLHVKINITYINIYISIYIYIWSTWPKAHSKNRAQINCNWTQINCNSFHAMQHDCHVCNMQYLTDMICLMCNQYAINMQSMWEKCSGHGIHGIHGTGMYRGNMGQPFQETSWQSVCTWSRGTRHTGPRCSFQRRPIERSGWTSLNQFVNIMLNIMLNIFEHVEQISFF